MRRRIETEFVRMQIWISDRKIRPLDEQQYGRMGDLLLTNSIPVHVVLAPEGQHGRELSRIGYHPQMTEADYLAFLDKGLAGFKKD